MHCAERFSILLAVALGVFGADNAREVESGVQILKTGPIQLIIPSILSFTLKDSKHCDGVFRICYISEPTQSRDIMRRKYDNVGWSCPPKTCTLWMEPEKGAYGLAMEIHDGNFYGLFDDDSDAWCPRYVVDSPSNFTVIDMPTCPVIVDGAMLPKDSSSPKPHNNASLKWIIPICVGFALLLLVIVIVVIYICTRK